MPDPQHKLVKVKDVGIIKFPSDMDDHHIAAAIHTHTSQSLPPELQRIQSAVGAQYVQGKPYGNAIATVGEHEPHRIEINDHARFKQSAQQVIGHELTHLLFNQLAGKVYNAIPKDNPNAPYDISDVDQLRAKGLKLWQLPQEKAAALVQTYVADPSQRARLAPWINDLNNAPLSVEQPTSPSDKGIISKIRPPVPPIEGYLSVQDLKKRAAELRAKFKPTEIIK